MSDPSDILPAAPDGPLGGLERMVGDRIEPALRPVLAVTLLGATTQSMFAGFLGIWAIRHLGAASTSVGLAFTVAAVLSIAAAFISGSLSDRVGRRPLLVGSWAAVTALGVAFLVVGHRIVLGLALVAAAGVIEAVVGGVDQVILTDLIPRARHESAFALSRIASNVGGALGPPIGAALVLVSWSALFSGVAALGAVALLVALAAIPVRGAYAPPTPPERNSLPVILHDRVFLLYLAAGGLTAMVYLAYVTLLPISLVQSHGLRPAEWGLLAAINPLAVTLLQVRLTRVCERVSTTVRLPVAVCVMGAPFLLLDVSSATPTVIVVICVFVLGEMLWVPAAQGVVARLAPADLRGAYLAAFTAMAPLAFAVTPLAGLELRAALGDAAMWVAVDGVAIAAALMYLLAATIATRSSRAVDVGST